eukprot:CAMPEP_0119551456 /NCGR_PEP_ID=MMETSP1352-20130426/4712_1 /TAXON_ID=265584 /ORGANISM="Stauroneis constricta, Strain CCMP1120" /LENGTH=518 /DNA_ID=CAMNT_0007597523 /DNA_START=38 /DNA_END=1595 /DNA_ORIENTATION=-
MANSGNDGQQRLKPFEWLSGGLFFGRNQKDGIESVDSCKDPAVLLTGIHDNFQSLLKTKEAPSIADGDGAADTAETSATTAVEAEGTAAAAVAAAAAATTASAESTDPSKEETDEKPTDGAFLEARLARLQFLLYDERRTTSQQDSRWKNANIATATMQNLIAATCDVEVASESSSPSPSSTTTEQQQLIPTLLNNLSILQFESRKHVAFIINYLLVCGLDGSDAELYIPIMRDFVQYVEQHFDNILSSLMHGYTSSTADVALHCGSIYRSCLKHVILYRHLVTSPERLGQYVYPFLDTLVHVPNFDISSDAMETLRHILTAGCADTTGSSSMGGSGGGGNSSGSTNPAVAAMMEETARELAALSAECLNTNYEQIWEQRFNPKLMSDKANYMTKRIALQILSTVLLTRSNYAVMIQYVNSRSNLIWIMKLLRDTSPHITMDAFHVFKVFVANPTKIPEVTKILKDNKEKLCKYLETLHHDREQSDTQFRDEKALIIATIRGLYRDGDAVRCLNTPDD